jgi:putative endonuclease
MTTQLCGKVAETLAYQYLKNQGLKLLTRNFYTRYGEIDLVMHTAEQLVFIEVRYRQHQKFGHPRETVTVSKQQKLARAAQYYLYRYPTWQLMSYRFDILAMTGAIENPEIQWIQNAFTVTDV